MKVKSLLFVSALAAVSFSATAADWDYESIAPNPKDVVLNAADFETVRINYGSDWSIEVKEGAVATLTNQETNEVINSTLVERWEFAMTLEGKYYLSINFPEVKNNGTYVLNIPAGTMTHEGADSPAITYTYTLNDPNLDKTVLPDLELLNADPVADTALPSVGIRYSEENPDGRVYTFNTNLNDKIGWMWVDWYDVTDAENPEWIASTEASHELTDTPLVVRKMGDETKMYENHTYKMQVTCYNGQQEPRKEIGKFDIQYKGSTAEYVYSDIKLTSIDPNPDTFVIEAVEEGHFTVSFSGPVEITSENCYVNMGSGQSMPYTSVESNDEKTEWTFVIPEQILKNYPEINCWVSPRDAEGRTLRADDALKAFESGYEAYAGFMFNYRSDMTGTELTVTPEAGPVTSLKSFTVTAATRCTDIAPSWNDYPYIMNGRDIVYTFNLENDMDNTTKYNEAVLTLPDEITEPGTYMLIIPKGTFLMTILGIDGEANKNFTAIYTITGETPDEAVFDLEATLDPASDTHVSEIEKVKITFPEGEYGIMYYDAYLLDEKGEQVAKGDVSFDFDEYNVFYATFNPAITAEGTYTLSIPEGTFGDMNFVDNMGETGHGSKAISATYVVEAGSVEGIAAEELTGDVYNVAGVCVLRNATAAQIQALDKGLYIVNGKKVMVK